MWPPRAVRVTTQLAGALGRLVGLIRGLHGGELSISHHTWVNNFPFNFSEIYMSRGSISQSSFSDEWTFARREKFGERLDTRKKWSCGIIISCKQGQLLFSMWWKWLEKSILNYGGYEWWGLLLRLTTPNMILEFSPQLDWVISAKYDCQDVSIQAACFPKPLVAGLTRAPRLAPTPSILYNIFIGLRPVLHVVYQLESQRCFLWADLIVAQTDLVYRWYGGFTSA